MLQSIHIRNFAIIDEVSVDFGDGMNVLTGETGAGKSILIDALGLALGQRASSDSIRHGADKAMITASFRIGADSKAARWLKDNDLDADGDCLLKRSLAADGPSRGYINGAPVPMQSLKQLGALLVNIHGQHEHQSLQKSDAQRQLLDARGGLSKPLATVAEAWQAWQALDSERSELQAARDQRDDRLAFLKFQLQELEALSLDVDELATLEPERVRLANSERLAQHTESAMDALYDNDSGNAQALLGRASRELAAIVEFDARLQPIVVMLEEAEIQVNEAADSLQSYLADIDVDPARQEYVEQRLASIQSLARKHRVEADALPAQIDTLRAEHDSLVHADETLDALAARCDAALTTLEQQAAALSKARKKAAKAFAAEVCDGMQLLGMPGGRFEVRITPLAGPIARHGADRVEFLVSANPGQPPQPVSKVASGGELSRISLAIQVAAGRRDAVSSMIFDEVDSGVGGGVAEMVGQQMRQLAGHCQVLAVTHLPQVAGQAHHHHKVSKITDGKTTRTAIATLDDTARIEEIARMLGGVEITDVSRDHAREMLSGTR